MSNLTAHTQRNGICVEDDEGGVWWPDEAAAEQIAAADDPEAEAVRICETEPNRGVWKS